MRAVDTNVLVRLLTRDEPKQVAIADAFVQHGAWVSVLALAEAMWVLAAVYERDAAQLAGAVEMLLNHQHLTLQCCWPRRSVEIWTSLGGLSVPVS